MDRFSVLKLHRRLALWAAAAVLIWGLSGLLHPVMSWTSPRPVNMAPPPSVTVVVPALSRIKAALGDREIGHMRVFSDTLWADGTVIDLKSHQITPGIDRARAESLARYYTGDDADIADAKVITQFDHEYPYINRYLPAWRVVFADGKTAYVETMTDRLGSITTPLKTAFQTVFENVHTLKFLEGYEVLRLALIAGLVGSVPFMALMGVFLHGAIRRRASGARKYHRIITLAVALPLLCFASSGLFHLVVQSPLVYPAPPAALAVKAPDLRFMPAGKEADDLRLVQGWWRLQRDGGITYMNAANGDALAGDEAFARHLAAGWGAGAVRGATLVTAFTPEYGFANKRLPVWRVEPEEGPVLFIEPQTGTLAARAGAPARAETWTFANLHKWQFLTNRLWRDGLMILTVLLGVIGVAAGLVLRFRKKAGF